MAEDFAAMEQSVLVDKLAEYTSRYMQFLMHGGMQEEIAQCRWMIEQLQQEIDRRQNPNKSPASGQPLREGRGSFSKNR